MPTLIQSPQASGVGCSEWQPLNQSWSGYVGNAIPRSTVQREQIKQQIVAVAKNNDKTIHNTEMNRELDPIPKTHGMYQRLLA